MVGPLLLIVIGVLFLLRNIYPYFGFDKMWPVILIVIGLAKVIEYFQIQPEKREDKKEGQ
jgi:hypothetical protein